MKILVLGASGMLGSAFVRRWAHQSDLDVTYSFRPMVMPQTTGLQTIEFDAAHPVFDKLYGYNYIINCIGVIKPHMASNMFDSIRINALFPRELATLSQLFGTKIIQIATDCVYSGKLAHPGSYREDNPHDALDEYGKTKSLGEDPKNAMILRTSIIGSEVHSFVSLLEWAKKNSGKHVEGYTNHYWNGMTTDEFARLVERIIAHNRYHAGTFHIFSPDAITKYDLLTMLNQRFRLSMKVVPTKAPETINRVLATWKEFNRELEVHSISQQIWHMH